MIINITFSDSATRGRGVHEARFWELLGGEASTDEGAELLRARLAGLPDDEAEAFGEVFDALMERIGGDRYIRGGGENVVVMDGDQFEFVRAFVIGSGREVFEAVEQDPARIVEFVDDEAECLLEVREAIGWHDEDSTAEQTAVDAALESESTGEDAAPECGFELGMSFTMTDISSALALMLHCLSLGIDQDPLWRRWLAGTGASLVYVDLTFHPDRSCEDRTMVFRRRKGELNVEWDTGVDGLRRDSVEQQVESAAEHLQWICAALATKCKLPSPPDLPSPVLPDWAPLQMTLDDSDAEIRALEFPDLRDFPALHELDPQPREN